MWCVCSSRLHSAAIRNGYKAVCKKSKLSIGGSNQMPRLGHRNTPTRYLSNHTGASQRFYVAVSLIAGGSIATFILANSLRKHSQVSEYNLHQIVTQNEALCQAGLYEDKKPCSQWDSKVDRNEWRTSKQFEAAVVKSRDLLQRAKDEVGAPGIVAAVSVDGQQIWSEGIGYADVENRTPCQPSCVMRIASISKPLTMTAVAKLWEQGKLDLDKPVQEYVPAFPEKEWKGEKVSITTRRLVSHFAGIRHYDKSYMNKQKNSNKNKDTEDKTSSELPTADSNKPTKSSGNLEQKVTEEIQSKDKKEQMKKNDKTGFKYEVDLDEMRSKREYKTVNASLDVFKNDPLLHKPGSKYYYTTHGWTLVSAVVEGASGKDFLTYMKNLLTELDLKYTVPDKHVPIIYNRARGYRYNKNGKLENTPYVDLSYKWAGGGYLSNVEDLIKFGNAMLYSYQYSPQHEAQNLLPGFLEQKTMQEIWKPIPDARSKPTNELCYAMGWTALEKEQKHGQCRPQRHYVAHSGGAMGFSSVLVIAPSHINTRTVNISQMESDHGDNSDSGSKTKSVIDVPPKGIVVAIITNLLDVGLSKTAAGIIEAFQEAGNQD